VKFLITLCVPAKPSKRQSAEQRSSSIVRTWFFVRNRPTELFEVDVDVPVG
jgi:hypothetical protein